jgi:hypothetical protein
VPVQTPQIRSVKATRRPLLSSENPFGVETVTIALFLQVLRRPFQGTSNVVWGG